MKTPKELRPIVKRRSRSPSAIAGGGGAGIEVLADSLMAPDRDILSDHGIRRLLNGGNTAAIEWLKANVVDEDARGSALVKTERRRK